MNEEKALTIDEVLNNIQKWQENDKSITLVTHEGIFHADDVFSTAFLMKVFNVGRVSRTSDVSTVIPEFDKEAIFNTDMNGKSAIVYDIGRGRFDHHQKDAATRPDGYKYCSFGLLWDEFGKKYISDLYGYEHADEIWKKMDKYFIKPIDLHDNGYELNPLSMIMKRFCPTWEEPQYMKSGFQDAVNVAKMIIDREVAYWHANIVGESIVNDAIDTALAGGRNWIILDKYIPYGVIVNHREDAESIQFAIYPSTYNTLEVCVGTVEIPGEYGSFRKGIAEDLRGLSREELIEHDWTFVHPSGFLGAALTVDAAIRMIEYSTEH